MDESETVLVHRDGKMPLRFSGRRIGFASSHRPGRLRWIEISIYLTADDDYVVAGTGRSSVPGETVRRWAFVHTSPEEVITRLERYEEGTDHRYLTKTAQMALSEAATADERIRDVFAVDLTHR